MTEPDKKNSKKEVSDFVLFVEPPVKYNKDELEKTLASVAYRLNDCEMVIEHDRHCLISLKRKELQLLNLAKAVEMTRDAETREKILAAKHELDAKTAGLSGPLLDFDKILNRERGIWIANIKRLGISKGQIAPPPYLPKK